MIDLYIIGAGGAAKEIFHLINCINLVKETYNVKAFVDVNDSSSITIGNKEIIVINEEDFLKDKSQKKYIVFGVANPKIFKALVSLYRKNKNFIFPSLIHPNVYIDNSIHLSEGNIISEACVFTVNINIGAFNYFNRGVHIGHDCNIASYNIFNPCAVISGTVTVANSVLIGTNATVLQNLTIGDGSTVGAGAVVIKDVEDNKIVVGVPAKSIMS